MWRIVALLVGIVIWVKFNTFRVPTDPFKWSCQELGSLWISFILMWMLLSSKYLN